MDPFEVRVRFTDRLKRLGASRDSILSVAAYALDHLNQSEDLFNCILEQLNQASLRDRLNLLYLIDALCNQNIPSSHPSRRKSTDSSLLNDKNGYETNAIKRIRVGGLETYHDRANDLVDNFDIKKGDKDPPLTSTSDVTYPSNPYIALLQTNLANLFEHVVPNHPNGSVNLSGARKVLASWRSKNLLSEELIIATENTLKGRQMGNVQEPAFSRDEVFKRIEEDRERHKRMKEENWIQPSDPNDRNEFEELYNSQVIQPLEDLFLKLERDHLHFLYDTTSLGISTRSEITKPLAKEDS